MSLQTFYLGTHETSWLDAPGVPLFVSTHALERRPRRSLSRRQWALDSGAFTELARFGRWRTSAHEYAELVVRLTAATGPPDFYAPQDWPCELNVRRATGLTVAQHQWRTLINYLDLLEIAPSLPWLPVVQGVSVGDYLRHVDLYAAHGIDLATLPLVGVGSVCRRQSTPAIVRTLSELHACGLRLHGFGVKAKGLAVASPYLRSADSVAWSLHAKYRPPLPGCAHASCQNCQLYALAWYERLIAPHVLTRPDRGWTGTLPPPPCSGRR